MRTALLCLTFLACSVACSSNPPPCSGACTVDAGGGPDAGADAGILYVACAAPGMTPTFASINTDFLHRSCLGTSCHSAVFARDAGGLDLETDPYVALLGDAGFGAPALNIAGSATGLVRVQPGDPNNSFLMIKLLLTDAGTPLYGSGMPQQAPGSDCPQSLAIISAWIDAGALNN